MKILLTGGSGFIGKYLTPKLSQHEVYHLKSDLRDYDAVRGSFTFQPNVTVHLAARTEVESFYEQVLSPK